MIWSVFTLLVSAHAYDYDFSDQAQKRKVIVPMTACGLSIGDYRGLFLKLYDPGERARSCAEVNKLLKEFTLATYKPGKRVTGEIGSVSIGEKIPEQCNIELNMVDGKPVGTPYGNKVLCDAIRHEGHIVISGKKQHKKSKSKEDKRPYVIAISQYGSPNGTGQSFDSKQLCEKARDKLRKENKSLDYGYECVLKKF